MQMAMVAIRPRAVGCRLWVISGHCGRTSESPLCPRSGDLVARSEPRRLRSARQSAAVTDDRVRSPEQRVRVRKERSALLVLVARPVDQPHHGLPERLAARKFGVGRLSPEKVGRQLARRLGMNRPVGHQQGARAGIKERASEAGGGFRSGKVSQPGSSHQQNGRLRVIRRLIPDQGTTQGRAGKGQQQEQYYNASEFITGLALRQSNGLNKARPRRPLMRGQPP